MPTAWRDCTLADLAQIGARRPRRSAGAAIASERLPRDAPRNRVRKYRNTVVYVGADRFDSRREADAWLRLREDERRGAITALQRQVPFDLCCPHADGSASVVTQYIADFVFTRDGVRVVADAKGVQTQAFKLKAKWMQLQHGIAIQLL
jgi:hypothetical protein